MNDVQANGEPKKIFLTKPLENPILANQPTTSAPLFRSLRSYSGDQVRIPPRRYMTPVDKYGEEHLTNHKKQRYWNSWEELYLVELWRRYKDELTLINVPLPVYRKMMIAMRNRNMIVTAQDCRRKINTLNTRYKQELLRMESIGCKSEWRLFPLVHCVLQPKIKEFDPWHEVAIIRKLLEKIPKPVEVPPTPTPNFTNNNNSSNYQTPQVQNIPAANSNNSTCQLSNPQTAPLNVMPPLSVHADTTSTCKRISKHDRLEKSILPFRKITIEKVEQLRQDNKCLAEQRDEDFKCLKMEEQNFQCFEAFIRTWTEQKEMELRRVQLMSVQSAISIENEENQNVEQQTQDTIAAK